MNLKIMLFSLVMFCSLQAISQTYIKPKYKSRSTPELQLLKIEITDDYTIAYFKLVSPETFKFGGWACASNDMYIEDVDKKKKYYMLKATGIPKCPEKHYLNKPGETVRFRLFFPRLRYDVRNVNIIEEAKNDFSFFGIYLKPHA